MSTSFLQHIKNAKKAYYFLNQGNGAQKKSLSEAPMSFAGHDLFRVKVLSQDKDGDPVEGGVTLSILPTWEREKSIKSFPEGSALVALSSWGDGGSWWDSRIAKPERSATSRPKGAQGIGRLTKKRHTEVKEVVIDLLNPKHLKKLTSRSARPETLLRLRIEDGEGQFVFVTLSVRSQGFKEDRVVFELDIHGGPTLTRAVKPQQPAW